MNPGPCACWAHALLSCIPRQKEAGICKLVCREPEKEVILGFQDHMVSVLSSQSCHIKAAIEQSCGCVLIRLIFSCSEFWDRLSCIRSWPQTSCVIEDDLELLILPLPPKCSDCWHGPLSGCCWILIQHRVLHVVGMYYTIYLHVHSSKNFFTKRQWEAGCGSACPLVTELGGLEDWSSSITMNLEASLGSKTSPRPAWAT